MAATEGDIALPFCLCGAKTVTWDVIKEFARPAQRGGVARRPARRQQDQPKDEGEIADWYLVEVWKAKHTAMLGEKRLADRREPNRHGGDTKSIG